ncbi:hypothetical protein KF913_12245 [Candidatus Obscuribacterales bacterium]|nr:hypothetical protein [Candidatus Obscuribacterales bacterium]
MGWIHLRLIINVDDALKRDFYTEMCKLERWSVRTLQKKIGSMLFERTALSRKPTELAQQELAALRKEDHTHQILFFAIHSEKLHSAISYVREKMSRTLKVVDESIYASLHQVFRETA